MVPLPRFLFVDDVPENRLLVTKTLLRKFPTALVCECEESAAAIAAAQHDRLTAIIVHRAVDVDGVTLIGQLRQVNSAVPIIMVSGRDSCPGAIEAGANAFLNYDGWLRIGNVVEETLVAERRLARSSRFPFTDITASPPPSAAGAEPRILYLEDDDNDVTLLRLGLTKHKVPAHVISARTPLDFSLALKETPDLILVDGNIGGFGTKMAMELARTQNPQIPILCVTGLVTEKKVAEMRDAGAIACLCKDDMRTISATIQKTLADVFAERSGRQTEKS